MADSSARLFKAQLICGAGFAAVGKFIFRSNRAATYLAIAGILYPPAAAAYMLKQYEDSQPTPVPR